MWLCFFRAFGIPISLRNRNRMRIIRGYERKAVAKARTIAETKLIKTVNSFSNIVYNTAYLNQISTLKVLQTLLLIICSTKYSLVMFSKCLTYIFHYNTLQFWFSAYFNNIYFLMYPKIRPKSAKSAKINPCEY